MKENKQKNGKIDVKKISIGYSNKNKNKSLISNNNICIINSQKYNRFINNNDKRSIAKHNSNYKLDNNIKKVEKTNINKIQFVQNLRNQYKSRKLSNAKNISHNEIILNNLSINAKPNFPNKKPYSGKNYSLNKSNLSTTNKITKKIKQIIPTSLEKKVNSYLIPKSITTNHHNKQTMKYNVSEQIPINTKKIKLIESKSNEKSNNSNILSNTYYKNNLHKFQTNLFDNNNGINNQKGKKIVTKIFENDEDDKNNDLKYNTYLNLIKNKIDTSKLLYQKSTDSDNNNKYLNQNNQNNNLLSNDKINKENINILPINNNNDIFTRNNKSTKNEKSFIDKKVEKLISNNEKEKILDMDIEKKVNNIIENLKRERKCKENKFININSYMRNEILSPGQKSKNKIENSKDLNKSSDKYNYKNDENNEKEIIKRNSINDDTFNKNIQQKSIELNGINKNKDDINTILEQLKIKEQNKPQIEIMPLGRENKTMYNLNQNKDFNVINNNKDDISNKDLLEHINSKILLQKSNIKYRKYGLINNRFQNNDIIKINLENIKNNYSAKKDLENINEKQNIPQLITQSLTGLVNLGETCYMNTGLQNLIHCVPFINQLFSIINDFKDVIEQKTISNSFIKLCQSIIKIDNYNLKYNFNSYNPSLFRLNFIKLHKQYADHEQHDSLEFIRILLDDISKELNQTKIISKYKELSTEGKSKEQQNEEYNDFYLCRENSIIVKVFYSQIMNIFICECGDISYSFEKILDIPLLFPRDSDNNKEIDLNDLIHKYFEGEDITWNLTCQNCHKKDMKRNKKIKITILPKVLIFSLQRFNPVTGFKINKYINFDEVIDLQDFCDNDFFNGEINAKYKLFGISNHSGTLNFGHYYSYTKVGNNWFEFNDSLVKLINITFFSKAAYFFFYEKID